MWKEQVFTHEDDFFASNDKKISFEKDNITILTMETGGDDEGANEYASLDIHFECRTCKEKHTLEFGASTNYGPVSYGLSVPRVWGENNS